MTEKEKRLLILAACSLLIAEEKETMGNRPSARRFRGEAKQALRTLLGGEDPQALRAKDRLAIHDERMAIWLDRAAFDTDDAWHGDRTPDAKEYLQMEREHRASQGEKP